MKNASKMSEPNLEADFVILDFTRILNQISRKY